MPPLRLLLLIALALPQSTPNGGAIAKFVPPVPTPASFIADQRRVLSDSAHKALDGRIVAIQRDGIGDVAVAIVPSIGDYAASQVGVEIYRTWRVGSVAPIGSERRNVGVPLLIVPKELSPNNKGECWITTGTGAEGLITDGTAGEICRTAIIPHLRTRAFDVAISSGLVAIEHRLRGGKGLVAPPPAERGQAPRGQTNGPHLVAADGRWRRIRAGGRDCHDQEVPPHAQAKVPALRKTDAAAGRAVRRRQAGFWPAARGNPQERRLRRLGVRVRRVAGDSVPELLQPVLGVPRVPSPDGVIDLHRARAGDDRVDGSGGTAIPLPVVQGEMDRPRHSLANRSIEFVGRRRRWWRRRSLGR